MTSRHIPESVKRVVRQKCRFGCIVCGLPIFHYDHIQPFAEGGEHNADNLALLCPTHHQDKTSGRLAVALVRRCAGSPANLGQSRTSPHLHLAAGDWARFDLGGAIFEGSLAGVGNRFEAIRIGGVTVFGVTFEDGFLLFDLLATDPDGHLILRIERGELTVATGVWDYRLEGKEMEIRSEQTAVALRLRFEDNGFSITRAHFVLGSTTVDIHPDRLVMNSERIRNFVMMGGATVSDCRAGIVV